MPTVRRKLSSVYDDFIEEIRRLENFDKENQKKYSGSGSLPASITLSKKQLQLMTEAIFFSGFRAYENFLRDIFILYCLEKRPRSMRVVKSYLKPKNFSHAESLLKSTMPFLDWASPARVIERADLYLEQGFPIKLPLTANLEALNDFKRIRNHIAHNSNESLENYKKVLKGHYGTIPLVIPSPGEFLLVTEKKDKTKYKLISFFDLMRKLAYELV